MNSSSSEREDRKSPVRRDEGRKPSRDEDQGRGRNAEKSRRSDEGHGRGRDAEKSHRSDEGQGRRREEDWQWRRKDDPRGYKGGNKPDPHGQVEVKAMPRPPQKREWTPSEKRAPTGPTSEPPGDWGRKEDQYGDSWSAVTDPLPGAASSSGWQGHQYGQWGQGQWHQWGATGLKLRPGGLSGLKVKMLKTADEVAVLQDWLYCRACQRHFKDTYAYNQHYRDKHQSVAPTAWAAWQRGQQEQEPAEVAASVEELVTPEDSVSRVGLPKRRPRRKGNPDREGGTNCGAIACARKCPGRGRGCGRCGQCGPTGPTEPGSAFGGSKLNHRWP